MGPQPRGLPENARINEASRAPSLAKRRAAAKPFRKAAKVLASRYLKENCRALRRLPSGLTQLPAHCLLPAARRSPRMRSRLYVYALAAAAAFFAVHPSALQAQESSHKLTVMDEFQIQLPTDPQISPDGKKVVYVRRFADSMTDRRYGNLWIVNADGTDHRPLTTGNRNDGSPRWSPDGSRLAYLSDADGKQQIYVRWMDSGQTARITNLDQSPDAIEWSPDGKMISFSS